MHFPHIIQEIANLERDAANCQLLSDSIREIMGSASIGEADTKVTLGAVNALSTALGLEQYLSETEYTVEAADQVDIKILNRMAKNTQDTMRSVSALITSMAQFSDGKAAIIDKMLRQAKKNASASDSLMEKFSIQIGKPWTDDARKEAVSKKVKLLEDSSGNAITSDLAFTNLTQFVEMSPPEKRQIIHTLALNGQLVSIAANIRETINQLNAIYAVSSQPEVIKILRAITGLRTKQDINDFFDNEVSKVNVDTAKRLSKVFDGKTISVRGPNGKATGQLGRSMCAGAVGAMVTRNLVGLTPYASFDLFVDPELYSGGLFPASFDLHAQQSKVSARSLPVVSMNDLKEIMTTLTELRSLAMRFQERYAAMSSEANNFVRSGVVLEAYMTQLTRAGMDYRNKDELAKLVSAVKKIPNAVREYTVIAEKMSVYSLGVCGFAYKLVADMVDNLSPNV